MIILTRLSGGHKAHSQQPLVNGGHGLKWAWRPVAVHRRVLQAAARQVQVAHLLARQVQVAHLLVLQAAARQVPVVHHRALQAVARQALVVPLTPLIRISMAMVLPICSGATLTAAPKLR